MPTTPIFYVNNPVSGTNYFPTDPAFQFIPNAASNITVVVQTFHGANGLGGLIAVTTLVAETFDVTTSTNKSQNPASSANTSTVISSNGTNGSDVFAPEGRWVGTQSVGSISMQATYSGVPLVPNVFVNAGTPAAPNWAQVNGVLVNTGTPGAPNWQSAGINVFVNTGTPASPVWTKVT